MMFCSLMLRVSKTFRVHCKETLVLPGFGWRTEEKPKSIFGGAGRFGLDRGDSGWSTTEWVCQQLERGTKGERTTKEDKEDKMDPKPSKVFFFLPVRSPSALSWCFFPPSSTFTSSFPSLHLTFISFLICSHIPSMAQFVISGISALLPSCPPPRLAFSYYNLHAQRWGGERSGFPGSRKGCLVTVKSVNCIHQEVSDTSLNLTSV